MSNLRLYTFTNFMLNTISQGIQPGHVGIDLAVKYRNSNEYTSRGEADLFWEWAKNHKTLISLNGGNHAGVLEKYELLQKLSKETSFPMPFCAFYEDQETLGGLLTSVGVILGEEVYDAVPQQDGSFVYTNVSDDGALTVKTYTSDTSDWKVIAMVKVCPLAR